jgi:hypothetical protein
VAEQPAQPKVAVSLERAHAELVDQGKGLSVVGFGFCDMGRLAPRRDLAEEAQGICLVAPFLVRTGIRQRPLGGGLRLLQMTGRSLCFAQGETTEPLEDCFRGIRLFHRLREQRHGVGDARVQGIRRTQGRSHLGEINRKIHLLTEAHGLFEPRERPGQVALAEG